MEKAHSYSTLGFARAFVYTSVYIGDYVHLAHGTVLFKCVATAMNHMRTASKPNPEWNGYGKATRRTKSHNHNLINLIVLLSWCVDSLERMTHWVEWMCVSDEQSVTCTEPAKIAAVNVNINVSGGEHGKKARGERLRLRENAFNGFSNPKTFSRNDEENEICIKLNQLNESAVYFFSSLVASIAPLTIWRWRYSFHSNYGNDANLRTRIAANPE